MTTAAPAGETPETKTLIEALRDKYPQHIVALCSNGKVGRWVMQRCLTGKGAARTGKGKTVYRKILLALYPPNFKLQP